MIPVHRLASLCAQIYDAVDVRTPAIWHNYWVINGVHIAHRREAGVDVLVLRGSQTIEDWLHDFRGWPARHPALGFCHAGFLEHMDDAVAEIKRAVGSHVVITGHSLGAARALILGALLYCHELPPVQITVFGSPRPGFGNLRDVLLDSGAEIRSYRNRDDPVMQVPYWLGLYVHPAPPIPLDVEPALGDRSPLREHRIGLYVEGVTPRPHASA